MTNIHTLLLLFHLTVGISLIVVIIFFQRGKGAEMGAAFGAGASATVFGAKGSANFLSRMTAVLATVFFATSLGLAYLASERPVIKSVIEQEADTVLMAPLPGGELPADEEVPALPEDSQAAAGTTTSD